MPRLRLLVVAFACACLIAPTAAAFGVATHLEWAEHHGAPHPSHHTVPPDEIDATPAADQHLDRSPHGHAIPELLPEPAVPRHREARTVARAVGAGVVPAATEEEASGARSRRLSAPARPGTSTFRPDLLHLHCALLI